MNPRAALLGGALLLLAASAVGWHLRLRGAEAETVEVAASNLPIPPVSPRIADGAEYGRCLDMLTIDPWSAAKFAETWQADDGGDAATHCLALSTVAMGEPDRGAAMLERLGGASAAPQVVRAAIYGQAAEAWLAAGEARDAHTAASLALALSPEDVELLIGRAAASAALDRHADSEADLSRALTLDAGRTDALVLRGTAWRHLGQLDHAQDSLDRALSQDPDSPEALLERGILRQRHDDREGARRDWERAIELAPDSAAADLAQQNLALLEAGPDRK